MQCFSDKTGTQWNIELNIGIMEEIKCKLKIDLLEPVEDKDAPLVSRFLPTDAKNVMLFVNTLFLLCEEQCERELVSSAQFGKLLGSAALKEAYEAFFNEWQDFFLSLGRTDIAEALRKVGILMQEAVTLAAVEVQKIKSLKDAKKVLAAQES